MKLGFLFLCKNNINQLQLWLDFFKNNYDKCNIYIHSYDQTNISQEFIKKYHIDKVLDTGWGDIYDVVRYVMNISIKNNDYKLILISESTIPVKSFDYIYNYLIKDNKGYLNYDMTDKYVVNMQSKRYIKNSNNIKNFKENIDFKHWYFNEAWIIFNIEMIEIILNDNKYHLIFKNCFCPDENYPIYLYSLYNKFHLFHNIKTTYTNWNTIAIDGKKHPRLYDNIDNGLLKEIFDRNILFARKFTDNINIYNKINDKVSDIIIYDMNNNKVDIQKLEKPEQELAKKYIKKDDVVLELGARYGSVSCVINNILSNKNNQVVVEPDFRVWGALEKNKRINYCNFNIVKGFISNKKLDLINLDYYHGGYGATSIENNSTIIPSYTLEEIKNKYNLIFNVLFADCEGFLEQFLKENLNILDNLRLIIFEEDYPQKCNYKKIKIILKNKNFKQLLDGFHNVWIK